MAGELKMQAATAKALGCYKLNNHDKARLMDLIAQAKKIGVPVNTLDSMWVMDENNDLWAWRLDSQLAKELLGGRGTM
jgi:hypothetical protein